MEGLAGKNVLITGGLGFIGSNLARRLVAEGARVTVCDALIEGYGGNLANVAEIRDAIEVERADVRDAAAMARLVAGKDVVFHLAAQVSHVMSLSNPYPDIDINIKGTAVVLEACRKTNPAALVVRSGTRGQYGPAVKLPVSEDDAVRSARHLRDLAALRRDDLPHLHAHPRDPDGAAASDERVRTARADEALAVRRRQLVRAPGARGPARSRSSERARSSATFSTWTTAWRRWSRAAGEPAAVGEILNVGHDRPSTFLEVAEILRDLVPGTDIAFTEFTPERKAQEPGDFVSDIAKIRRLLGWEPTVSLRDGLARTVAFYRERRAEYF